MLLAFDIGNSHIVVGVFEEDELLHTWRIHTDDEKTGDEYSIMVRNLLEQEDCELDDIEGCVLGNVVPALQEPFERVSEQLFGLRALSVDASVDSGIAIEVDYPPEVGADRIANAVGACQLYRAPAIVIDFGTATTFDVISADEQYLGGSIAPGIVLALDALVSRAARLFGIELVVPERAIGNNTVEAMQSGLMLGYVGLIEGLVERIKGELRDPAGQGAEETGNAAPLIIATGGLAPTIGPHVRPVDVVDPDLTLHGLRLVYERTQRKS